MAAPITTTATTLEGQFVEVAGALAKAEQVANAAAPNSDPIDNVQVVPNIEDLTIEVTATIPGGYTAPGAGVLQMDARSYLQ